MRLPTGWSVTAISAWHLDVGRGEEVEIDDGFERLDRWAVVQAAGQCREPVGILGLWRQQFCDSISPTLRTAVSIRWAVRAGRDQTGRVECLAR